MSGGNILLASVVEEVKRLREQLELERAARMTAESYAKERGDVIRQLEDAVAIFKGRCEELSNSLKTTREQQLASLPARLARGELYREVLAEIERAMHRLGNGCGFGHEAAP